MIIPFEVVVEKDTGILKGSYHGDLAFSIDRVRVFHSMDHPSY
jgi:hypothetical protein